MLTKWRKPGVALGFILALIAGIAASTHLRAAQTANSMANLQAQDAEFVQRAIHGAALQIELEKVAAVQGENPRIREFATAGVQNFSKAEDVLGRPQRESLNLTSHLQRRNHEVAQQKQELKRISVSLNRNRALSFLYLPHFLR